MVVQQKMIGITENNSTLKRPLGKKLLKETPENSKKKNIYMEI